MTHLTLRKCNWIKSSSMGLASRQPDVLISGDATRTSPAQPFENSYRMFKQMFHLSTRTCSILIERTDTIAWLFGIGELSATANAATVAIKLIRSSNKPAFVFYSSLITRNCLLQQL